MISHQLKLQCSLNNQNMESNMNITIYERKIAIAYGIERWEIISKSSIVFVTIYTYI